MYRDKFQIIVPKQNYDKFRKAMREIKQTTGNDIRPVIENFYKFIDVTDYPDGSGSICIVIEPYIIDALIDLDRDALIACVEIVRLCKKLFAPSMENLEVAIARKINQNEEELKEFNEKYNHVIEDDDLIKRDDEPQNHNSITDAANKFSKTLGTFFNRVPTDEEMKKPIAEVLEEEKKEGKSNADTNIE